jgi:ABC-2 type transport system permease protein
MSGPRPGQLQRPSPAGEVAALAPRPSAGAALAHTAFMAGRHLVALWRQPWWIAVSLVQPVIWLLLFGALFKRVVDIPGFHGSSYIDFLTPGVVVMTALFSASFGGMPLIEDIERGVLDRFLASPASRGSLIWGRLAQGALVCAIQSLIIAGLALAVGADLPGGPGGVALLVLVACLLNVAFAAFSNGLALLARREETLIAVMNFLIMPLTFLSTGFMEKDLLPGWIQTVAGFNPVNWAVEAGREAVAGNPDWGLLLGRAGLLAAFCLALAGFSVRAFGAYQRSM